MSTITLSLSVRTQFSTRGKKGRRSLVRKNWVNDTVELFMKVKVKGKKGKGTEGRIGDRMLER